MSPSSEPSITDTPKWYKQFWPWFLITIPVCSMILSFNMLRFALVGQDTMVVDDYYKQGKSINLSLEKVQEAKRRGMQTALTVNEQQISLRFIDGAPPSGAALRLSFYHVTQEPKDQTVDLFRDANGVYRGSAENDLTGKWQIALTPHDQEWKIQQTLSLPQEDSIAFNP
ncbi:FixH family protein [uncultured Paraglaciecola sp.]|uniref:FixH family protein n=1 Tax=uncultured Paraglaciecola sp. TaxID=1765024 RepID=UPI0030D89DAD